MDSDTLLPIATLILGLIGGYLADYLREGREASRQRAAARRELELATLLELQDALARLARGASRVHYEDSRHEIPRGERKLGPIEDETNEAFSQAARDVYRLRVRVPEESLRGAVEAFTAICTRIALPDPGRMGRSQQRLDWEQMSDAYEALNEQLGERIRTL